MFNRTHQALSFPDSPLTAVGSDAALDYLFQLLVLYSRKIVRLDSLEDRRRVKHGNATGSAQV